MHKTRRLVRRRRLCRGDVLLRLSLRRQGGDRDFRTMDDFFLVGIRRGKLLLQCRPLVLPKSLRIRGGACCVAVYAILM